MRNGSLRLYLSPGRSSDCNGACQCRGRRDSMASIACKATRIGEVSEPAAVVVVGMHRSGTSALAGVIHALGAAGPKTPLAAHDENPRGFFESEPLMRAHDALLASAGTRWHDWRQLDPQWLPSPEAERHRRKIETLLIEEFGDKPFIVVKDPRICRFLTFTLSALDKIGKTRYHHPGAKPARGRTFAAAQRRFYVVEINSAVAQTCAGGRVSLPTHATLLPVV